MIKKIIRNRWIEGLIIGLVFGLIAGILLTVLWYQIFTPKVTVTIHKVADNKAVINDEVGLASWYVDKKTASGEKYHPNKLTAAHLSLPFGTMIKVTNIQNNKSVIVKINDRGGFKKYGRTIDLSRRAFLELADLKQGVIKVKIEIIS